MSNAQASSCSGNCIGTLLRSLLDSVGDGSTTSASVDWNNILTKLVSPTPTTTNLSHIPIRVRLAIVRSNSFDQATSGPLANSFPSFEASAMDRKLETFCPPLSLSHGGDESSSVAVAAADITIADLTQYIVEELYLNNKEENFIGHSQSVFMRKLLLGTGKGKGGSLPDDVVFNYGGKITNIKLGGPNNSNINSGKSDQGKALVFFSLMEEMEGYPIAISPSINAYEMLRKLSSQGLKNAKNRKKLDLILKARVVMPNLPSKGTDRRVSFGKTTRLDEAPSEKSQPDEVPLKTTTRTAEALLLAKPAHTDEAPSAKPTHTDKAPSAKPTPVDEASLAKKRKHRREEEVESSDTKLDAKRSKITMEHTKVTAPAATKHPNGIQSSNTPAIDKAAGKKKKAINTAHESDDDYSGPLSNSDVKNSDAEGSDKKDDKNIPASPFFEHTASAAEAEGSETPQLYSLGQPSYESSSESGSDDEDESSNGVEEKKEQPTDDPKAEDKDGSCSGDEDMSSSVAKGKKYKPTDDPKADDRNGSSSSSSSGSSSDSDSTSSNGISSSIKDKKEEETNKVQMKSPSTGVFVPLVCSSRRGRRTPLVSMNKKIVINASTGASQTDKFTR